MSSPDGMPRPPSSRTDADNSAAAVGDPIGAPQEASKDGEASKCDDMFATWIATKDEFRHVDLKVFILGLTLPFFLLSCYLSRSLFECAELVSILETLISF